MAKERIRAATPLNERVRLAAAFAFALLSLALAIALAVTLDDFLRVGNRVQSLATIDRIDRLQRDLLQQTTSEELAVDAYVRDARTAMGLYKHGKQRSLDDSIALRLAILEEPALSQTVNAFLTRRSLVDSILSAQVHLTEAGRRNEARSLIPEARVMQDAFQRSQARLTQTIDTIVDSIHDEIASRLTTGRNLSAIAAICNLVAALAVAFLAYEYARFRHVAERDDLTGLNNRRHFERALLSSIKAAERSGTPFALFYMDLDGFKAVNDTYGHRVGDELLRAVARRLEDNVDHNDVVARLGGDEFGLIVSGASEAQAASIASRLTGLLAQPYALRRNTLDVGCSMGFSVHPNDGVSPSELVQAADQAMYRVKRAKVGVIG